MLVVLANYAMTQALNRCVPFFKDEKVGFDLVGLDTVNSYEIPLSTFTDKKNGKIVSGAKVFFRVCSNMDNIPSLCTKVN